MRKRTIQWRKKKRRIEKFTRIFIFSSTSWSWSFEMSSIALFLSVNCFSSKKIIHEKTMEFLKPIFSDILTHKHIQISCKRTQTNWYHNERVPYHEAQIEIYMCFCVKITENIRIHIAEFHLCIRIYPICSGCAETLNDRRSKTKNTKQVMHCVLLLFPIRSNLATAWSCMGMCKYFGWFTWIKANKKAQ